MQQLQSLCSRLCSIVHDMVVTVSYQHGGYICCKAFLLASPKCSCDKLFLVVGWVGLFAGVIAACSLHATKLLKASEEHAICFYVIQCNVGLCKACTHVCVHHSIDSLSSRCSQHKTVEVTSSYGRSCINGRLVSERTFLLVNFSNTSRSHAEGPSCHDIVQ